MSTTDLLIPSVLDLFRDHTAPRLADGNEGLLGELGFEDSEAGRGQLGDFVDALGRGVEQTLSLLVVCGYSVPALVLAASEGSAIRVVLGTEIVIEALAPQDLDASIADAVSSTVAVLGFEAPKRAFNAVTLNAVEDDWLILELEGVGPSAANLPLVLAKLKSPLEALHANLLDDLGQALSGLTLAELRGTTDIDFGFVTLYDSDGWPPPTEVANPDDDADWASLLELGSRMVTLIDEGPLADFLIDEFAVGGEGPSVQKRLGENRTDRQLLRRAMKGTRRLAALVAEPGHRRNFRFGQTRRLTYTELLLGCNYQGVVNFVAGSLEPGEPGEPGVLEIEVTSAIGMGLERVRVQITTEGAPPIDRITNALGAVTVHDLPPGRYTVHAAKEGFVAGMTEVVVGSGVTESAAIHLADLEASLDLTPSGTPRRGESVTATIVFAPTEGETLNVIDWTYEWTYQGVGRAVVRPSSDAAFATSWSGPVAVSGLFRLTYQLRLSGGLEPEQVATAAVTVQPRTGAPWQTTVPVPAETSFAGQPSPPREFRHLGRYTSNRSALTIGRASINAGPNAGLDYLSNASGLDYTVQTLIHPDLLNSGSQFSAFHAQSNLFQGDGNNFKQIPSSDFANLTGTSTTTQFDVPDWEAFYKKHDFYRVTATMGTDTRVLPDVAWHLVSDDRHADITTDSAVVQAEFGAANPYTFAWTSEVFTTSMTVAEILIGTRSHESAHAIHSHHANLTALIRALEPAGQLESEVHPTSIADSAFTDECNRRLAEIDKLGQPALMHKLVDEASSQQQAKLIFLPAPTMAEINRHPDTGAFLGIVWNLTANAQM